MEPSCACPVCQWFIVRNRSEIGFGPACFNWQAKHAMPTYKSTPTSMFFKPPRPLDEIEAELKTLAGCIMTMAEGLAE